MTPGETLIKKCTNCSGLVEQETINSGNTFGAVYWSDGKLEAPMLPDNPWMIKCPHCKALLWIDALEQVGSYEPHEGESPLEGSAPYKTLKVRDYYTALKDSELPKGKLFYLRLRVWWTGNDCRRNTTDCKPLSSKEQTNLEQLALMLELEADNDRLMMAEIKRELGLFDEADAILSKPFDELSHPAEIIKALNDKQETCVTEIKYES